MTISSKFFLIKIAGFAYTKWMQVLQRQGVLITWA